MRNAATGWRGVSPGGSVTGNHAILIISVGLLVIACLTEPIEPAELSTDASEDLPCMVEISYPYSELRQLQYHQYDEAGRLVVTEHDFDGDGTIDEIITREYDADGRLVREVSDGGQGLLPDGTPDVTRSLFYECVQEEQ